MDLREYLIHNGPVKHTASQFEDKVNAQRIQLPHNAEENRANCHSFLGEERPDALVLMVLLILSLLEFRQHPTNLSLADIFQSPIHFGNLVEDALGISLSPHWQVPPRRLGDKLEGDDDDEEGDEAE